jgi:predicted nucleic acid-binding protein
VASKLSSIPTGTNILIDANIFVYGLTAKSAECVSFLNRCSTEEVYGITLFEVVHEATHEFMRAEGRTKGLYTDVKKAAKYLMSHPDEVKKLTGYWTNTKRLLSLNIVFLPMEMDIVRGAQTERVSAGLLTNDSVIVAAMREYGISHIATSDKAFDSIVGISAFAPADI